MHILYIHQHFAVPSGNTGTRSYEFARRWVRAGHKVTVITGHYDIGGLEPGNSCIRKQTIDGIDVVIVGAGYSNKQSYLRRIASFLNFIFFSVYVGLRIRKVDAIYATSTPLTVGIPAMILKTIKRIPFVFEVRDQWPEIPIELGIIRNKLLIKALLWLEKTIYESSSAIVALSPGMATGIATVLTVNRPITVIPNSCDTHVFTPDVDGSDIRREHGWADKFLCMHFGAIGRANGLDFVVQAAERLQNTQNIHFVIIGDGSEKARLVDKVRQLGLKNIEFLAPKRKSDLPEFVAAGNVSLVIFADHAILQHNSANKFFDSLSAGKPILLNYSGWQREVIESNKAGFGCELYDLDEFVEKVLYFNGHRDELLQMGKNARRVGVTKYDRQKLATQALAVIEGVRP